MSHRAASFVPAALATALAVALATIPLAASAQQLPKRKSGLWEITMDNSAAKKAGGPRTMSQCVDASKDDIARQAGQQMERENKCKRSDIQQGGGKISFESSCEFGPTKMTSQTTITGDFQDAYHMEIRSKFDPPMMGMSDSTTTMDAKYMGACKPGMRPGDVQMMGMTMNVYDMMEGKGKK